MFEATSNNIRIEVEPAFERAQSDPRQSYYYFSYRVRIHNLSSSRVQLLSRHWIITDGFGQIEEVSGPGVIGLQPTLRPGEIFEYASFCPLTTPVGSMKGKYLMRTEAGAELEVQIPVFILSEPNHYH